LLLKAAEKLSVSVISTDISLLPIFKLADELAPALLQLFELCSTEQSAAVASSRDQLRCQALDDGVGQTLFARQQPDGIQLVGKSVGHGDQ
jgi:hypothetical protein